MFGNPLQENSQTPDYTFDPFSVKNSLTFGGTQPSLPTILDMVDSLTPPPGVVATARPIATIASPSSSAVVTPPKPAVDSKQSFLSMDVGALEEMQTQLEKLIENKKYTKIYKDKVNQGLYLLDLVSDRVLVFLVDNPQPGGALIPFVLDSSENLEKVLKNPDLLIDVKFASIEHLQQVLLNMYENIKIQCLDPINSWAEWLKA